MFAQTETGVGELWSDVAALRLDRAQHCVVPFQLTHIPAGATVLGCTAGIPASDDKYAFSDILVGDGHGNQADVSIGEVTGPAGGMTNHSPAPLPAPNRTVNGHHILWLSEGMHAFLSDDYDGVPLALTVEGSYTETQATQLLAGLRMSTDLFDPARWPTAPVAH
jgi:hypothetical protein